MSYIKRLQHDYSNLIEKMLDGFALHEIICDSEGHPVDYRFIAVNPAFESLTELKTDDVIGKTVLEIMPDTEKIWIERYGRVALTGEPDLFESYSGVLGKYYRVSCYSPQKGFFATIFSDVTQNKMYEQEILSAKLQMESIINGVKDLIIEYISPDMKIIWGNRNFAEAFNIAENSLVGEHCYKITANLNEPCPGCPAVESVRTEEPHDGERRTPDGRYWDLRSNPVKKNGKVIGIVHMAMDVTQNKMLEDALRESEKKYRAYMDMSPYPIFVGDKDANIVEVNEAGIVMTGYDRGELMSENFRMLIFAEKMDKFNDAFQKLLDTGGLQISAGLRKKSGESVNVAISASRLPDGSYIAVCRDTSREHALEEQLRHSQRMESVGRLAGGIAHDFNNMLVPIIGYTEMLIADMPSGDPRRREMKLILDAAERAKGLTRQLLAFSRKQLLDMTPFGINDAIRDFIKILRRTVREDIKINCSLALDVGMIMGDVSQIEQVIMNLIVNAQDAMPSGGVLTIETKNAEIEKGFSRKGEELAPGPYVMLAVSDTGVGMTAEIIDHMFEPFFTTKSKGCGTGLGLSTVYGIVKQHQGGVFVYSEPGDGSCFKIYLPRMLQKDSEAREGGAVKEKPAEGSDETVMIVEDNQTVRDMVNAILSSHGYKTIVFSDPSECLKADLACVSEPDPDLLLTDVIMPGMNGKQLYEQLKQKYEKLKVLYMSGYTDDAIAGKGILEVGMELIQKPFGVNALLSKVNAIIKNGKKT